MGLPTSRYRALIDAATGVAGLPYWERAEALLPPGVWLEGLILTGSSGNPRARRYEAHQDQRKDADTPLVDDGDLEDDASYGLMQVVGYNVRRLVGAPDVVPLRFAFVFLPLMGLALGLRVLVEELAAVQGDVPAPSVSAAWTREHWRHGSCHDSRKGPVFRPCCGVSCQP